MALTLAPATQAATPDAPITASASASSGPTEALVEVRINGEPRADGTLVLIGPDDRVQIRRTDLRELGIDAGALAELAGGGELLSIDKLPGIRAALDPRASRLDLAVQPSLLRPHVLSAETRSPQAEPSRPGAFLNYDAAVIRGEHSDGVNGLLELGAFNGPGFARASWLASSSTRSPTRLESSVEADFPGHRLSLRLGDTLLTDATGGAASRIAGISVGTDFSTTPDFIPFPLPAVAGEALVPSVIDLVTSGTGLQQFDVPAGPFTIDRIPVPTGAGEMRYRVRDLLGRERVVTQRYYVSPELLKKGLTTWKLDAGARRLDFGLRSNAYSGWGSALMVARGLSDRLTGRLRAEAGEGLGGLETQLAGLIGDFGIWRGTIACSATAAGQGCRFELGLDRQMQSFGVGVDVSHAAKDFDSLTISHGDDAPRTRAIVHVNKYFERIGSISLISSWRESRAGEEASYFALEVSRTLPRIGHLGLLVAQMPGSGDGIVSLQFTRSLSGGRTISGQWTDSGGSPAMLATMAHNPVQATGLRYAVSAGHQDAAEIDADVAWTGERVATAFSGRRSGSVDLLQASASGAVTWLGGRALFTRKLEQGFVVADIGDAPGVPVYHEGRVVAHTGSHGLAVIPQLRAFERNSISIDPAELPLSVDASSTEVSVVPYRRGGVFVRIPLYASALIRLVDVSGVPIPGAATVKTDAGTMPVGLDGLVFVRGAAGEAEIQVEWEGRRCLAHTRLPAADPAEILTVLCRESI